MEVIHEMMEESIIYLEMQFRQVHLLHFINAIQRLDRSGGVMLFSPSKVCQRVQEIFICPSI